MSQRTLQPPKEANSVSNIHVLSQFLSQVPHLGACHGGISSCYLGDEGLLEEDVEQNFGHC